MKRLFDNWKAKIPSYDLEFREILFDVLTQKGGGSESKRMSYGKHFANNYEFYIYAFFLGLYRDEFLPIEEGKKKVNFSYAIQLWGSKGRNYDREDFTKIQEYIFMALIAKTDIDLIALEKGEITEKEVVSMLMFTMESYTNGGLTLIKEQMEDKPNYFLRPTGFMDFVIGR